MWSKARCLAIFSLCLYTFDIGSDCLVGRDLIWKCHQNYGISVFCLVLLPGFIWGWFDYFSDRDGSKYGTLGAILGPIWFIPNGWWKLLQAVIHEGYVREAKTSKSVEMSFESFPQLILGIFIIIGLQINNSLNFVSCGISALSVVYGFGEIVVLIIYNFKTAPFKLTVVGMLSTVLDSLLRAFFMAYILSIIKAYALIIPPTYVVFLFIWLKVKEPSLDAVYYLTGLMSFGSSALKVHGNYQISFRLPSKVVFGIIFVPTLFLVTYLETASLQNTAIDNLNYNTTESNITQIADLNFNQTLALTPDTCENLCSEDDETKDYCANLWKEMEFENHLKIVITLSVLFIFSSIEGLLDGCFSWTPYNMLHDFMINDRNNDNDKNNDKNNDNDKNDEDDENDENDKNDENDEHLKLNIPS